MRFAIAAGLLCVACHVPRYDPVDEIEFDQYTDARSALAAVLLQAGPAKVYAVGEYHATRQTARIPSPLTWFTYMIDVMAPHARHLVLEAWLDDGCASTAQVGAEIAATTERHPSVPSDLAAVVTSGTKQQLVAHGLSVTCLEQTTVLDAMGRVDFLALLELVTDKLGATAKALTTDDRAVIVYGGALHNDLYPRWQMDTLTYAVDLQRELGGGVVEIDLVVPEIVAPMPGVRREEWFPLIGRAAPNTVLVWRRGPTSFVMILPAQSTEVGRIARPHNRA